MRVESWTHTAQTAMVRFPCSRRVVAFFASSDRTRTYLGNPIGGLVFTSAYGQLQQAHEWTNFMAADQFCIRVCKDGPRAPALCQHIYDVMGARSVELGSKRCPLTLCSKAASGTCQATMTRDLRAARAIAERYAHYLARSSRTFF